MYFQSNLYNFPFSLASLFFCVAGAKRGCATKLENKNEVIIRELNETTKCILEDGERSVADINEGIVA